MKQFLAWSMAALMAAVVMAGCIGGGDSTATGDTGPSGPDAVFDADTGAIQGVVQTSELLPIGGATVGTQDGTLAATSDQGGGFALNKVDPGKYVIFAQALGFESAAQNADVVAGQATELSFVLDPVPTDAPYVFSEINEVVVTAIMWKLTPECIYTDVNTLAKTCGGYRPGCEPSGACEVHYDEDVVTREWKTIVAEIDWEPQTGLTGRGFSFDLNAPNITRGTGGSINQADPYTFSSESDVAPIVHRVDLPTTLQERGIAEADWYPYEDDDCTAPTSGAANCDWFYRVFAAACDLGICPDGLGPDYGLMYEGRATVYISVFIKEPAEPNYSLVPDV